jgi:hypothetical protein
LHELGTNATQLEHESKIEAARQHTLQGFRGMEASREKMLRWIECFIAGSFL